MKCPVCPEATLAMTERQGIEIDYCPTCRGIWLDRGELDKLIELGAKPAPATASAPGRAAPYGQPDFVDSDFAGNRSRHGSRSRSWLSDLFD